MRILKDFKIKASSGGGSPDDESVQSNETEYENSSEELQGEEEDLQSKKEELSPKSQDSTGAISAENSYANDSAHSGDAEDEKSNTTEENNDPESQKEELNLKGQDSCGATSVKDSDANDSPYSGDAEDEKSNTEEENNEPECLNKYPDEDGAASTEEALGSNSIRSLDSDYTYESPGTEKQDENDPECIDKNLKETPKDNGSSGSISSEEPRSIDSRHSVDPGDENTTAELKRNDDSKCVEINLEETLKDIDSSGAISSEEPRSIDARNSRDSGDENTTAELKSDDDSKCHDKDPKENPKDKGSSVASTAEVVQSTDDSSQSGDAGDKKSSTEAKADNDPQATKPKLMCSIELFKLFGVSKTIIEEMLEEDAPDANTPPTPSPKKNSQDSDETSEPNVTKKKRMS